MERSISPSSTVSTPIALCSRSPPRQFVAHSASGSWSRRPSVRSSPRLGLVSFFMSADIIGAHRVLGAGCAIPAECRCHARSLAPRRRRSEAPRLRRSRRPRGTSRLDRVDRGLVRGEHDVVWPRRARRPCRAARRQPVARRSASWFGCAGTTVCRRSPAIGMPGHVSRWRLSERLAGRSARTRPCSCSRSPPSAASRPICEVDDLAAPLHEPVGVGSSASPCPSVTADPPRASVGHRDTPSGCG